MRGKTISYFHNNHICPITGKHTDYVWSDHDKPGVLNSCRYCSDYNTMPLSLHDLQLQRIQEDKTDDVT